MFFADKIPQDVQRQVTETVGLLSKVVWPALATLVPVGVTAAFKWVQDHSGKRRSAELTERISLLAKSISDLPEVPVLATLPTPRAALTSELEGAIRELTALQTKARHRVADSVATTTAKVRSALLLYRPRGFAAWSLHLLFYAYSVFLVFMLFVLVQPATGAGAGPQTRTDVFFNVFLSLTALGILGIPPIILRYYAAKIHRRQCAQAAASSAPMSTAVCPEPLTATAGSQPA